MVLRSNIKIALKQQLVNYYINRYDKFKQLAVSIQDKVGSIRTKKWKTTPKILETRVITIETKHALNTHKHNIDYN